MTLSKLNLRSHNGRVKRQRVGPVISTETSVATPSSAAAATSTATTSAKAKTTHSAVTSESETASTTSRKANPKTSTSASRTDTVSSTARGVTTGSITRTATIATGTTADAGSTSGATASSSSGIGTGAIIGIIAAVVVIAGAIAFVVIRKKRSSNSGAGVNKRASTLGNQPLRSEDNFFNGGQEKNGDGWGANGINENVGYGAMAASNMQQNSSNDGRVWGEEKINVVSAPSANYQYGSAPPLYPPSGNNYNSPPSNGYQSPPPQFDDYSRMPNSAQPLIHSPQPVNPVERQFSPAPTQMSNTNSMASFSSSMPLIGNNNGQMTPGSEFFAIGTVGPNRADNGTPSNVPPSLVAGAYAVTKTSMNDPLTSNVGPQTQAQTVPQVSSVPAEAPLVDASNSPFADSPDQGKIFEVVRTFEPNMSDELVVYPGDKVQILMSYDDGWVLGLNLSANPPLRGVFPRDCVEDAVSDPAQASKNPSSNINAVSRESYMIPEEEEDEPSELPYGPPSPKNKVNDKAPFLPPIDFVSSSAAAPTIAVQAPTDTHPLMTTSASSNTVNTTGSGKSGKRASSLIASRDAELFMALGEALDTKKKPE